MAEAKPQATMSETTNTMAAPAPTDAQGGSPAAGNLPVNPPPLIPNPATNTGTANQPQSAKDIAKQAMSYLPDTKAWEDMDKEDQKRAYNDLFALADQSVTK